MQVKNDQYFISKTIVYDLVADSAAVLIEKKPVELVSVEECCFHKYTSATGPAGVLLDVSKINIKRSSFVRMVSKVKENTFSAASAKLLSDNTTFTLSSASKCEIGTNDNFLLYGKKESISFINNTHNPINHITFAYIYYCEEGETSFCMVCHNPSGEGVEFQSHNCSLAQIRNCVFAHNTRTSSSKSYGVVRLFRSGRMEARDLYFFKNDETPLSQDNTGTYDTDLTAESIYTDNNEFYSVTPSNVLSVGSLPIYIGEDAAVVCKRLTREDQQRCRGVFSIAVFIWICKPLSSYSYLWYLVGSNLPYKTFDLNIC